MLALSCALQDGLTYARNEMQARAALRSATENATAWLRDDHHDELRFCRSFTQKGYEERSRLSPFRGCIKYAGVSATDEENLPTWVVLDNITLPCNAVAHVCRLGLSLLQLDLRNCKLQRIPDCAAQLQSLISLNVSHNEITTLPPDLPPTLRKLIASENRINAFPEALLKPSNVQELSLSDNPLIQLQDDMHRITSSITALHLCHTRISNLPEGFGQCHRLELMSLGSNHLSALPDDLKNLQTLRQLDLRNNHFVEIPKCVENMHGLTHIWVDPNPLSERAKRRLHAEQLQRRNWPRLQHVVWI